MRGLYITQGDSLQDVGGAVVVEGGGEEGSQKGKNVRIEERLRSELVGQITQHDLACHERWDLQAIVPKIRTLALQRRDEVGSGSAPSRGDP